MTQLKAKNEVHFNGAHFEPQVACIPSAVRVCIPYGMDDDTLWITSANDGEHKDGSLHYINRAFDFRTRNVTVPASADPRAGSASILREKVLQEWASRIRAALGHNYDVVLEKDHLHVEWDPK